MGGCESLPCIADASDAPFHDDDDGAGDSLKTRMKRAFKVLDADRDGKISKVELADMFGALGADKATASTSATTMMAAVDTDGDELITFAEFCGFWDKLHFVGKGREWDHAHQIWIAVDLEFDGSKLRVRRTESAEDIMDDEEGTEEEASTDEEAEDATTPRRSYKKKVVFASARTRLRSMGVPKPLSVAAKEHKATLDWYDLYLENADMTQDDHNGTIFHINLRTSAEFHMFSVNSEAERKEWVSRFESARISRITLMPRLQLLNDPVTQAQPVEEVGSFCFGAVLNRGGFGVVRCGYCNTSGEPVAAKIMSLKVAIDLKNEIVLQSALRHPNVVALKDIIIERDQVFMVMQYATGGDLFARVVEADGLKGRVARYYFRQLMTGVAYCHRHYVIHRDLKLENIMLSSADSQSVLKLIDFGFAKNVAVSRIKKWKSYGGAGTEHLNSRAVIGTAKYVAPEMLDGEVYDGMKTDIWACGVILYTMIFADYPFQVGNQGGVGTPDRKKNLVSIRLKEQLAGVSLSFSTKAKRRLCLDPEFKSLVRAMLERDPEKRLSCEQVLAHEWMKGADVKGVEWDAKGVDSLLETLGHGEVVMPDKVDDNPNTWLRAYYEAPIKRLSTKSKSATRLKSKSESSKSKSVDAVTIPVADVTSI